MRGLTIVLAALAAGCATHTEEFSTNPPSLHVGQVAIDNAEFGIAVSVANARLERAPGDPDDLLLRARGEAGLGQPAAAMADFRQVLAARPDSAEAALGLARLLLPKDPAGAEALLAPASQQRDAPAALWNNLGVARDLLGRHSDAQAAYRKALEADPALQSAQVNLAHSLSLAH